MIEVKVKSLCDSCLCTHVCEQYKKLKKALAYEEELIETESCGRFTEYNSYAKIGAVECDYYQQKGGGEGE